MKRCCNTMLLDALHSTAKFTSRGSVVKMTSNVRRKDRVFFDELESIVDEVMTFKSGE